MNIRWVDVIADETQLNVMLCQACLLKKPLGYFPHFPHSK